MEYSLTNLRIIVLFKISTESQKIHIFSFNLKAGMDLLRRLNQAPNRIGNVLSGARFTHFEVFFHGATSLIEVNG